LSNKKYFTLKCWFLGVFVSFLEGFEDQLRIQAYWQAKTRH